MIGSNSFDINEMGEALTRKAVEKVLSEPDRNGTLILFIHHPACVIPVRMFQWKAVDGDLFFGEIHDL